MKKITSFFVLITFIASCVMPPHGFAQAMTAVGLMPEPGMQVALTAAFTPTYLKGMKIDPANPFKFDFLIYRGDENLTGDQKQVEYPKLIKYFLAALAVPDKEQWVNLSPYEQDRIIPDNFGLTEMGRDLLAQDYLLKQMSASLTNPDSDLGKKFWDEVYSSAQAKFGTTNIPTDTFNKVWITPDKAVVYEKGDTVYVLENHLKVQMEKDYEATSHQKDLATDDTDAALLSQQVMREVIIPALEKEVNEGKNFAPLRQVYSGMLLATWYKRTLKETILGKLYADQNKVKGVDQDPKNNQQIYEQYVQAFQKGVVNMIKEDVDRFSNEVIPRKYFSGGMDSYDNAQIVKIDAVQGQADFAAASAQVDAAAVVLKDTDASMFNERTKLGVILEAVGKTQPYSNSLSNKVVGILNKHFRDDEGAAQAILKFLQDTVNGIEKSISIPVAKGVLQLIEDTQKAALAAKAALDNNPLRAMLTDPKNQRSLHDAFASGASLAWYDDAQAVDQEDLAQMAADLSDKVMAFSQRRSGTTDPAMVGTVMDAINIIRNELTEEYIAAYPPEIQETFLVIKRASEAKMIELVEQQGWTKPEFMQLLGALNSTIKARVRAERRWGFSVATLGTGLLAETLYHIATQHMTQQTDEKALVLIGAFDAALFIVYFGSRILFPGLAITSFDQKQIIEALGGNDLVVNKMAPNGEYKYTTLEEAKEHVADKVERALEAKLKDPAWVRSLNRMLGGRLQGLTSIERRALAERTVDFFKFEKNLERSTDKEQWWTITFDAAQADLQNVLSGLRMGAPGDLKQLQAMIGDIMDVPEGDLNRIAVTDLARAPKQTMMAFTPELQLRASDPIVLGEMLRAIRILVSFSPDKRQGAIDLVRNFKVDAAQKETIVESWPGQSAEQWMKSAFDALREPASGGAVTAVWDKGYSSEIRIKMKLEDIKDEEQGKSLFMGAFYFFANQGPVAKELEGLSSEEQAKVVAAFYMAMFDEKNRQAYGLTSVPVEALTAQGEKVLQKMQARGLENEHTGVVAAVLKYLYHAFLNPDRVSDAMQGDFTKGGIDLNSAALDMQIKRDGNGIVLPVSQQDLDNIRINGLVPVLLDIRPATSVPLFSELPQAGPSAA